MIIRIEECVILDTGGSRGIENVIALRFAEEKCDIVITYNSNKEEALKTEKLVYEYDAHSVLVLQMGVVNEKRVRRAKEVVEKICRKFNV